MTDLALASVLDEAHSMLRRYVSFPNEHSSRATALWVAHTYSLDLFESTPRLVLRSAEKQSGKTRCQEVIWCLVHDPLATANATVAALFRSLTHRQPTILLDEYDTYFGASAVRENSEDLRGLLNAGHRRNRPVLRCVGPASRVEEFPCFAAVCLAGIRGLPDTIEDRSIIIEMRRRSRTEPVKPFREGRAWAEASTVREGLQQWAAVRCADGQTDDLPEVDFPEGVTDRAADVWEPLLRIGEWAGGDWLTWSREAASHFVQTSIVSEESLGVRLLHDIRTVWPPESEKQFTRLLLTSLCAIEDAPWGGRWMLGDDLSRSAPGELARELRHYGIGSSTVRIGDSTAKGYARSQFRDVWARYLPDVTSHR